MVASCKLTKLGSDYFFDPTLYKSIVGTLQYSTITRPEQSYAVNKVCQFMSRPLKAHWTSAKRIFRYLKGTLNHGLHLRSTTSTVSILIRGLCDTDWASDPRRSQIHLR